ncbi:uncharacterized protein AMSG_00032 [Thecamonas trahens ATCC 50062]|uniref:Uncharacterized protein n=1 Tax=Thecamonas trahens ATCC 50062 TaxID=461836 RepID=A0A0L0D108_THETB|nr:hypothetical protein AMSG_00032 [Thecamonas trahens ATCC 50062]KNC45917.1 hypothetical protein AMSG_00032 [Thecamonas trahens ATCC 50062]|eukprot:XP_013762904.1 hypothetical protein AMSG_00032 [Thecamonas trahens ATCC 50062]
MARVLLDWIPFNEIRHVKLVGQGSFGKVFRAEWHGNDVAIKIPRKRESEDTGAASAGPEKKAKPVTPAKSPSKTASSATATTIAATTASTASTASAASTGPSVVGPPAASVIATVQDSASKGNSKGNSKSSASKKSKSSASKKKKRAVTPPVVLEDISPSQLHELGVSGVYEAEKGLDRTKLAELAARAPNLYHAPPRSMGPINAKAPLTVQAGATSMGAVYAIDVSPSGALLAATSVLGSVSLWDMEDLTQLRVLRDESETQIDEFWVARFTPDGRKVIVAGKLKNRALWSEADNDNAVLPCPIKIFDVLTGELVARLEGHTEEVVALKVATFCGSNYIVSCSQDGSTRRWRMSPDWTILIEAAKFCDNVTCMSFTASFVPHTGNAILAVAADDGIVFFDFGSLALIQRVTGLFGSYCDCIKFVDSPKLPATHPRKTAHLIARGCEMLDAEECTVASKASKVVLYRVSFVLPPAPAPATNFELISVKEYAHPEYNANSYLMRATADANYVYAPSVNGEVFIWGIKSAKLVAVLRDHEEREVRDIVVHPHAPLLLTSGDDGKIYVYRPANPDEVASIIRASRSKARKGSKTSRSKTSRAKTSRAKKVSATSAASAASAASSSSSSSAAAKSAAAPHPPPTTPMDIAAPPADS